MATRAWMAAALILLSATARADEQAIQDAIRDHAKILLLTGDLAEMDRLASGYRKTQARTPPGFSDLSLFYDGFEQISDNPQDIAWANAQDDADKWLAHHPNSPAAVVIDAKLLVQHAWAYRRHGSGYAIPADAEMRFQFLVDRAKLVLLDHERIGSIDPEWFALIISVANWEGANKTNILAMSMSAADIAPYYEPIHYAAVDALLPRVGGSPDMVQRYIAYAHDETRDKLGDQIYARIYLYMARRAGNDIAREFAQAGEQWPQFRTSMQQVIAAYPDGWNVNAYRVAACAVGARDDYNQAMRALADHYENHLISINWADTPQWQQRCQKWESDRS